MARPLSSSQAAESSTAGSSSTCFEQLSQVMSAGAGVMFAVNLMCSKSKPFVSFIGVITV